MKSSPSLYWFVCLLPQLTVRGDGSDGGCLTFLQFLQCRRNEEITVFVGNFPVPLPAWAQLAVSTVYNLLFSSTTAAFSTPATQRQKLTKPNLGRYWLGWLPSQNQ